MFSVTQWLKREASGSIKALLLNVVNTGKGQTIANRYTKSQTEEYSGKQAWVDRWPT